MERNSIVYLKTFYRVRAFSLIEVLVSIFILGVMMAIASTSFLNLSTKYRLKKSVWEINSRMNYARYKAIFDSKKMRIKFAASSYSIESFDEIQEKWTQEEKDFMEGVIIQANNSPIFHPGGTVSNLASIYVSNSWGKYKITIAITGRIKIVLL